MKTENDRVLEEIADRLFMMEFARASQNSGDVASLADEIAELAELSRIESLHPPAAAIAHIGRGLNEGGSIFDETRLDRLLDVLRDAVDKHRQAQ